MSIYDFTLDELENYLVDNGFKKYNATQIFEGIYKKRVSSFEKLSVQEVYKIIELLGTTDLSYTDIGRMFSVSQQTISSINRCKTWKELHSYKSNIREEMRKNEV